MRKPGKPCEQLEEKTVLRPNTAKPVLRCLQPDALALLNMTDAHHLKCLMWAVYDGMLLVGPWMELPGDHPWCTVLAGLHKYFYRDCEYVAHCLPHTLGSWDCQEWIEVLQRGDGLSST